MQNWTTENNSVEEDQEEVRGMLELLLRVQGVGAPSAARYHQDYDKGLHVLLMACRVRSGRTEPLEALHQR